MGDFRLDNGQLVRRDIQLSQASYVRVRQVVPAIDADGVVFPAADHDPWLASAIGPVIALLLLPAAFLITFMTYLVSTWYRSRHLSRRDLDFLAGQDD
jgi:hypothetical protein